MRMNNEITYRTAQTGLGLQCAAVLRTVPQWFGREDALRKYVEKIAELDTYTAWKRSELIGFISVLYHNEASAELYVLAVDAAYHRKGIGTHLYRLVEEELIEKGVRFIRSRRWPNRPAMKTMIRRVSFTSRSDSIHWRYIPSYGEKILRAYRW